MTQREWLWANAAMHSRSFVHGDLKVHCTCPGIDMANHRDRPTAAVRLAPNSPNKFAPSDPNTLNKSTPTSHVPANSPAVAAEAATLTHPPGYLAAAAAAAAEDVSRDSVSAAGEGEIKPTEYLAAAAAEDKPRDSVSAAGEDEIARRDSQGLAARLELVVGATPVPAGSEVTISYGRWSNDVFLLLFGFVPVGNAADAVVLFDGEDDWACAVREAAQAACARSGALREQGKLAEAMEAAARQVFEHGAQRCVCVVW